MKIGFGKYKKIFLAIIFVLAVVLIGFSLYFVFFKSRQVPSPPQTQTPTSTPGLPHAEEGQGQITEPGEGGKIPSNQEAQETEQEQKDQEEVPTKPSGRVTQVSNSETLNPVLSLDENGVQFYNKDDGKFYRVDKDGNMEILSDKVFNNVDNISWAPTKDKAVIEYPDGSNVVYNFNTQKQVTLPKHWEDFNFSSNGNHLVFKSIGRSPENRWLAISDDKGAKTKAIEEIGENADKVYPSWSPNNQMIAMYTQGIDFNRQEVYFIGKHDENFKSTTIPGRDFEPKWSKTGDHLLYSVYSKRNDLKPQLWTVNATPKNMGAGRKSLDVNTWAHKCTFSSNNEIYCGVPRNLPKASGLFKQKAKAASDDIYKINTKTGQKELLANLEGNFNMTNLNVTANKENLYFTDKNTNKIHQVDLSK